MNNIIHSIPISKLIAHPKNPNVMGKEKFKKLIANIERTGLYEPIVVRRHPKKKDCFEIINGHHRVKTLKELGKTEANCVVWDVDDEQAAILLTTLNRLAGSDEPGKKIELLKELSKKFSSAELSKLLPNTKKQIEQLTSLKLNDIKITTNIESFAIPLVFFVTREQKEIIEKALETAPRMNFPAENFSATLLKDCGVSATENRSLRRSADNKEMTNSQRRAEGLTEMAKYFISNISNNGLQSRENMA